MEIQFLLVLDQVWVGKVLLYVLNENSGLDSHLLVASQQP